MRQVLLVIDGEIPTRAVFQYATDLCQRVRAELRILQFLEDAPCLLLPPKRITPGENSRDTLTAAGEKKTASDDILGRASAPLKKLLADRPREIPFKLALSADTPEKALTDYVDTHHDIILTVFDPARDQKRNERKKPVKLNRLKRRLGVPLVIVKP